jgi:hypothetical protein
MLFSTLQNTNQRLITYLLKAVCIAVCGSTLVAVAIKVALPDIEAPSSAERPPLWFLYSVCLAPVLETLLMIPIFAFIRIAVRRPVPASFLSASLWAGFHSLQFPYSGLSVFVPFFVFSMCFVSWDAISRKRAIITTALLHSAYNLLPASLFLYYRFNPQA